MEIIALNSAYYIECYNILKKLHHKDIDLLNIDTRLLVSDHLIGFYAAKCVDIYYNVYNFYIKKEERSLHIVYRLIDDLINRAKSFNIYLLVVHTEPDSRLDRFVLAFCRRRKYPLTRLVIHNLNVNVYKVRI